MENQENQIKPLLWERKSAWVGSQILYLKSPVEAVDFGLSYFGWVGESCTQIGEKEKERDQVETSRP
jgi:hypothetical protein